jgi:hypothetical protein
MLSLGESIPFRAKKSAVFCSTWRTVTVSQRRTKAKASDRFGSRGNRFQAGFFQPLLHVALLQRHEHFVHLTLNK